MRIMVIISALLFVSWQPIKHNYGGEKINDSCFVFKLESNAPADTVCFSGGRLWEPIRILHYNIWYAASTWEICNLILKVKTIPQ